MLFPPDIGFGIQIVTFLLLWWILKLWLFDPTMRVLDLRRQRMQGPLAEADRLRHEASEMRTRYDTRIESAREAARREIDEIRRQAELDEQVTLEAARGEAERVITEARAVVAKEIEAARASIARYAAELSVDAGEKILGRPVR
jgi:F-type H+-transporting ATPase subunit b